MERPAKIDSGEQGSRQAERKPYERPRILLREPLEGVAAVCGASPAKSNPSLCPQGPISS